MSIENTIIASVIFERSRLTGGRTLAADGQDERLKINHYGRKMLRMRERGRIRATDSDQEIAAALSSGLLTWLFWQISEELLMFIIAAIRRRIWESESQVIAGVERGGVES
jgi:hypothetical protein